MQLIIENIPEFIAMFIVIGILLGAMFVFWLVLGSPLLFFNWLHRKILQRFKGTKGVAIYDKIVTNIVMLIPMIILGVPLFTFLIIAMVGSFLLIIVGPFLLIINMIFPDFIPYLWSLLSQFFRFN